MGCSRNWRPAPGILISEARIFFSPLQLSCLSSLSPSPSSRQGSDTVLKSSVLASTAVRQSLQLFRLEGFAKSRHSGLWPAHLTMTLSKPLPPLQLSCDINVLPIKRQSPEPTYQGILLSPHQSVNKAGVSMCLHQAWGKD